MMASTWSAVIGGGVAGCAFGVAGSFLAHSAPVQLSPGSANAVAAPKPLIRAAAIALPATARRRIPVCNVISSYRQREPNSHPALLLGAGDLGADGNGQPLVPIRIGIQVPGVTGRLRYTLSLERADQRPVGRAQLHIGHHMHDVGRIAYGQ